MSRFCPLFSSSKGNSIYLSGGGTALLVDAGVSYRRLCDAFAAQGLDTAHLHAVLITHEHTDHIKGLKTLLKRLPIPLYATRGTLEFLCANGYIPAHTPLVECSGSMCVGDIEVTAFDTPHDAVHSVGFRFTMPDQRTIAVATDLGIVTPTVQQHLTGCDLVMLESNYDSGMLDCSSYPYYLKRRIRSEIGHLANEACATEILRLLGTGSTRFVLGHLSEHNNVPALAYQVTASTLGAHGVQEGIDYMLHVAPVCDAKEMIVF